MSMKKRTRQHGSFSAHDRKLIQAVVEHKKAGRDILDLPKLAKLLCVSIETLDIKVKEKGDNDRNRNKDTLRRSKRKRKTKTVPSTESKSKRRTIDIKSAYENYDRINFGCSVFCVEKYGSYDLTCKCSKVWHSQCLQKYSKKDISFLLESPNTVKFCLCCKRKSF